MVIKVYLLFSYIMPGQSGILKEGFDHSTKDYDAIVMAIYNSLWAYGGW